MAGWPTLAHKREIFKELGYVPNPTQWPIHQSRARIIQVVGAERAGKSLVSASEVVARMTACRRIAFVADEYDHSRKEFLYTEEALTILGMMAGSSKPRRGAWSGSSIYGCDFVTISVNTGVQKLTGTGEAFDIIVICEAGLQMYNTLIAARGRVAETRGMVLLAGTLWDNVGWYADLFLMGQKKNNPLGVESFSLPAWSNLALFPGGKNDPEIIAWEKTINDPDEAARRIHAIVKPSPARMYPQFSELIHVKSWVKFDPQEDVYLFVDSGWFPSHYAVLAVQFKKDSRGREIICVFDEIWVLQLEHEQVIAMAMNRIWWENVFAIIGGHETKAHAAAKSTAEVWRAETKLYFRTFDAGYVLEGARRVRTFLNYTDDNPPRLFLSANCKGTVEEFKKYNRRVDRNKKVISEQPQDKNNDALDALRNGLVWRYGHVDLKKDPTAKEFDMKSPFGN